jgi:hypothetical protein
LERLLAQVNADTGTNSQRLAKALILEMLIREKWNTQSMDLLAFAVFELGQVLSIKGHKILRYVDVLRTVGTMLRVSPGDLKHGILSIKFIRSVWAEGWPSGLVEMFRERWAQLQNDHDGFVSKLAQVDVAAILQLVASP